MPFQYRYPLSLELRRPFVTYGPHDPKVQGMTLLRKAIVVPHAGYDVWDESYQIGPTQRPRDIMVLRVARTKAGHYIGMPDEARYLVDNKGISPELRQIDHQTCSIGRSATDGKWYGWSHRALQGFQTGDVVRAGDCHAEKIPPGTRAHNEAEAKWFAEAFAEAVS
jgi:hypothetical protein